MFCSQSAEEGSHEELEACGNENDKFPAPRDLDESSALSRASAASTASLYLEQLPRFPCGPDKSPLVAGGFKAATTDPAQIAIWRAQFPNCLWGVPTGVVSGIDVLDIDPEGLGWFEGNRHRIPVTRVHRTPRGGLHFFFKHAPGLRCSRGRIAPGVDVRADGGYVIWWPQ